jgi:hypothetical protein
MRLADGEGFEPSRRLRACRFSRPVPSTTRPPIQSVHVQSNSHRPLRLPHDSLSAILGAELQAPARRYLPIPPSHYLDLTWAVKDLDDAYLKELYGDQRPSLQRVITFYSQRLKHLAKANKFYVVWIEKEALPWIPPFIELSALRSVPVVMDFDDAWHLRYTESPNPVVRFALTDKLGRLAKRADHVIVANKFLQNWAEGTGASSVRCVPTVVDLTRYEQRPRRRTPSPSAGSGRRKR